MKKLICILLILALGSTSVFAQAETTEVESLKLFIDNIRLHLLDSNDEPISPLVVDGVVYVPLDAFIEAIGGGTHWDVETGEMRISLSVDGNSNSAASEEVDALAQELYSTLCRVAYRSQAIGSDIYSAMNYGLRSRPQYRTDQNYYDDFLKVLNISTDHLEQAIERSQHYVAYSPYRDTLVGTFGLIQMMCKSEFYQICVMWILDAYTLNGSYNANTTDLARAKELLSQIRTANPEYPHYNTLLSAYTEVYSFANFVQAPNGTLETIRATVDGFRTKFSLLDAELSIWYGE